MLFIINIIDIKTYYLFSEKPPVQLITSLAANVICKKPVASSSRARFKLPASTTASGLPLKASIIFSFESLSSPARRTVVFTPGATSPLSSVAAKLY